MNYFNKINSTFIALIAMMLINTSCNKEVEQIPEATIVAPSGPTLDQVLKSNPDDSLYYNLVVRGGQLGLINDINKSFTMFVTNNNGMKPVLSAIAAQYGINLPPNDPNNGYYAAFISQIPVEKAAALVQCNTMPQTIKASSITNTFPNFYYPSAYNPAPQMSSLARLDLYPSSRNGYWLNNVPIVGADQMASNGVIHHTALLVTPPQKYLWQRISTDNELTYLKAAIIRADSGVVPSKSLQSYLNSFGPNFTVFAPVDTAFKATLRGVITLTLISQGVSFLDAIDSANTLSATTSVFSNPSLYSLLSAKTVKGLLAYHVLGARAFTNNFPTSETIFPTLLNTDTAYLNHPGVKLKATFGVGSPFVSAATIIDINRSTRDAHLIINTTPLRPDPIGTSDQHYINGVLHKIDAVLMPQP
jgi:uncharacterized surface protein with fasciclin (FAS1) repeats